MNEELRPTPSGVALPAQVHAVVLVSNLLAPTLRALAFAQATAPASIRAVKVAVEGADDPLPREWEQRGVPVPLVVIESPYRETVRPVQLYVRQLRRDYPGDVISIIIPEYVVGHWWQNLLHNQTALRLKARLLFEPWVTVTSVPWVMGRPSDDRHATKSPTCGRTTCSPTRSRPRARRSADSDGGGSRRRDHRACSACRC